MFVTKAEAIGKQERQKKGSTWTQLDMYGIRPRRISLPDLGMIDSESSFQLTLQQV